MVGDIIHPGIVNILKEAEKLGNVLVGLFTDSAIAGHKRLPHMSYEQRESVVASLRGVWKVVPQSEWSYVPNLLKYKPEFIIHGDDWISGSASVLRAEVFRVMAEIGGRVVEVPYTKGISSSLLADAQKSIGTTPEVRMSLLSRMIAAKSLV